MPEEGSGGNGQSNWIHEDADAVRLSGLALPSSIYVGSTPDFSPFHYMMRLLSEEPSFNVFGPLRQLEYRTWLRRT